MLCAPLLNTINRFVRKVQKNGETAKFRAQLQVLPIFVQQQRLFRWRHPPIQGRIRKSRPYNPSNKKNIIFVQDIHHIRQAEAVQLGIGLGGGDMVAENFDRLAGIFDREKQRRRIVAFCYRLLSQSCGVAAFPAFSQASMALSNKLLITTVRSTDGIATSERSLISKCRSMSCSLAA